MAGIPGDPSTPDGGWWTRADAITFVRVAFSHSKIEAEKHLLDYICAAPPTAWRSLSRINVRALRDGEERTIGGKLYRFDAARRRLIEVGKEATASPPPPWEEKRTPLPSLLEDIKAAIQSSFWRLVREGFGRAKGNSAFYAGPVFHSLPAFTVKIRARVELEGRNGVTTLSGKWWVEVELSVIQFAAAPLIAAVRARDGSVDAAIEKLRSLGRLPSVPVTVDPPAGPTSTNPIPICQRGKAKQWVAQMLKHENCSSKNFEEHAYVDKVLLPHKPPVGQGRLCNIVSEIAQEGLKPGGLKLWQGTPPKQTEKAAPLGPKRRSPPLHKGGS
jgi:hypothetical protein